MAERKRYAKVPAIVTGKLPGRVVETLSLDATLVVGKDVLVGRDSKAWVDVTSNGAVAVGWSYDGTAFTAPPVDQGPTKSDLLAYANRKRRRVAVGGTWVNLAPSGQAPAYVHVGTDDRDVALYDLSSSRALRDQSYQMDWIGDDGTTTALTATQVVALADQVDAFEQAAFAALGKVAAAIAAGSLSKREDVESSPLWPSNAEPSS